MKRKADQTVILVTEPGYFKSVIGRLSRIGEVVLGTPTRRDLERMISGADIAVVRVETRLNRGILSKAKRLKLIASATTGINHIDAEFARQRGIQIIHLHGAHTQPTAEHTLALILSLARKIPGVHDAMNRGRWERERWIGMQLAGKTIGIIGLGRIGRRVAALAAAFGMRAAAYDPYVPKTKFGKVERALNLRGLLRKSDVISVHASLTSETRGMIGPGQFKQMKPGALLINTARGEIIDETALIRALKGKRIGGAAVDVYAREPLPPRHPLRACAGRRGHLILTPHLGASTAEAVRASADEIARGVEKFFLKSNPRRGSRT